MPKKYINPDELFQSRQYGFSQVVATSAGQVGWDKDQRIVQD